MNIDRARGPALMLVAASALVLACSDRKGLGEATEAGESTGSVEDALGSEDTSGSDDTSDDTGNES